MDALSLVLRSLKQQTQCPSSIVVADDGSGPDLRHILGEFSDLPIVVSWQPDAGFRAARTRNLGLLKINTPYVIFIDGDCICPPQFVQNHPSLASPKKIVTGGRVLLTESETAHVLKRGLKPRDRIFSHTKFKSVPLGFLRDLNPKSTRGIKTCNLGLFLADALLVDGFDEGYTGWGLEDSDFVERLLHKGLTVRNGRLKACVAHLYHPEESGKRLSPNASRLERVMGDPSSVLPSQSVFGERE